MEDHSFSFGDPYESFFSMSNPTLAALSINNNGPNSTALPQQNQNHNHHGVLLQQGQSSNHNQVLFSDPLTVQLQQHFNEHNFSFGGGTGNNFEAGSSSHSQQMHGNQIQSQHSINGFPLQMHGNENQNQPLNGFLSSQMNGINQSQPNANGFIPLSQDHVVDVFSLATWPPIPAQFFCSCCQVLREIIHTNGTQFEKLEIHGRHGFIGHAIHNLKNINGDSSMYQMIDFCRKSLEEIKNFLADYCVQRTLAGYFILQDPMSPYYETLCTGMDWIEDINMEEPGDNPNSSDEVEEQVAENGTPSKDKNLSEKRKIAGKMTLSDLRDYFHLPIEEAAKRVDLCPTVIKKVCRKAGLTRWPYRKVKSILKQVALLASTLNSGDAASRARSEGEINRLKQEMIRICGDIAPTEMYNIIPM